MLFCSSQPKLWTLQFLLQRLVMQTNAAMKMAMTVASKSGKPMDQSLVTTQTITYATLMVATLPIVVIYPFLQKYFVSGLMLGSVKG
jgi:putative aldouronate transport system permease protein